MNHLFLVRYPEEPLQVPEKGKLTIGHADDNDIVLPEPRVSRKHASIEFKKHHYLLSDLGSSNGTFLNSSRLTKNSPVKLQNWDKIRVASAVFTARIVEDKMEIMDEFKELRSRAQCLVTEKYDLSELLNEESQPGFAGDLAHLCPVEIFQMIESGEKTGILEMRTPVGEATFALCRGHICKAAFNQKTGEEAVYDILNVNQGTFVFTPEDVQPDNPEITMSITFLLIEGCRRLDEEAMGVSQ